jgi:hypothetical protein
MQDSYLLYNLYPQKDIGRFNVAKELSTIGVTDINYPFIGQIFEDMSKMDEETKKIIRSVSTTIFEYQGRDIKDLKILKDTRSKEIEDLQKLEEKTTKEIKVLTEKEKEFKKKEKELQEREKMILKREEELKKKEKEPSSVVILPSPTVESEEEEEGEEEEEEDEGGQGPPIKEDLYKLYETYLNVIWGVDLDKKKNITKLINELKKGSKTKSKTIPFPSNKMIDRNKLILYDVTSIISSTTLKEKSSIINYMNILAKSLAEDTKKDTYLNYHTQIIYFIIYNEKENEKNRKIEFDLYYLNDLKGYKQLPTTVSNSTFITYEKMITK